MCTRQYSNHFADNDSINAHNNPKRERLLFSFYRWEDNKEIKGSPRTLTRSWHTDLRLPPGPTCSPTTPSCLQVDGDGGSPSFEAQISDLLRRVLLSNLSSGWACCSCSTACPHQTPPTPYSSLSTWQAGPVSSSLRPLGAQHRASILLLTEQGSMGSLHAWANESPTLTPTTQPTRGRSLKSRKTKHLLLPPTPISSFEWF